MFTVRTAGKKHLVADLQWDEMRANKFDESYPHLRSNGVLVNYPPHIQIGRAEGDIKSGSYSAAVAFKDVCDAPSVYIEDAGDGKYWVIGTTGQHVSTAMDCIVDEHELNSALSEWLSDAQDLTTTCYISPECDYDPLGFTEVKQFAIEELIPEHTLSSSALLKPLDGGFWRRNIKALVVVFVLIVASCAGAYMWYLHHMEELKREAAELRQSNSAMSQQEIETSRQLRAAQAVQAAYTVDTRYFDPDEFVSTCVDSLLSQGSRAGGWVISAVTCKQGISMEYEYKRDSGTLDSFSKLERRASFSLSNDKAVYNQRQSLEQFSLQGDVPARETLHTYLSYLQSLEHMYPQQIDLENIVIQPRLIQYTHPTTLEELNVEQSDSPIPLWSTVSITITGTDLWALKRISFGYEPIGITQLEFSYGSRGRYTWALSLRGVVL